MNSEHIGGYRVVDLSKKVDPATSARTCRVTRFFQESTRDYHSEVTVESHLGTHVETPLHYADGWKDILDLPVTAFLGRAVLLSLQCGPNAAVTAEILDRADRGRVRPGDIALLASPHHCEPFSNNPNDPRPYLCRESGEWFVRKQVKCIGFGDAVAIEHSVEDACAVHETVMPRDIMFLEVLQNLDQLRSDVFLLVYQPMPIKGLDSCCVRAVAIEGIPGLTG